MNNFKINEKEEQIINIENQLEKYIVSNNIPNIIFYGEPKTGKKRVLKKFIMKIYNNDINIKNENTFEIDCMTCKGIKLIREVIKPFLKLTPNKCQFKTIILNKADCLTDDAQSSLRQCIEENSKTTRFFAVVNKIDNLLNPIISRFSLIFFNKFNEPPIYFYNQIDINTVINDVFNDFLNIDETYQETINRLSNIVDYFSHKGISCINIINFVKNNEDMWDDYHCCKCYVYINNILSQIKNEKLCMFLFLIKLFIDDN